MDQAKLASIFERQNTNGTFVYDDQEVRQVLPALFFLSGGEIDKIQSEAMKELMEEFCGKLGLPMDTPTNQLASKAAVYYKENPPNAQMLRELHQACE